jgi:cbb3-type cytochrome oxidase cytochrome c subunit
MRRARIRQKATPVTKPKRNVLKRAKSDLFRLGAADNSEWQCGHLLAPVTMVSRQKGQRSDCFAKDILQYAPHNRRESIKTCRRATAS